MIDVTDRDSLKRMAAEQAVDFVESGMVLGLGTGSTVSFALQRLSGLIKDGLLKNIAGIPSSRKTEDEAKRLGIPLSTLDIYPHPDLTIDGADEVDPELNLIKGRGGASLREKILVQASSRTIIIVDESKLSPTLGTNMPVPVEVLPFAVRTEMNFLQSLKTSAILRIEANGKSFKTDEGNYILDCNFGPIESPAHLADILNRRAGIVGHGLFIRLVSDVVVAGEKGIRHLRRDK